MSLGGELFIHMMIDDSAFRALELAAVREICSHNRFLANISLKAEERERDTIIPHWINPNAWLPTPEPE